MRKILVAVALLAASLGASMAPKPAEAAWGCHTFKGATITTAFCFGGTYQAVAGCRHLDGGSLRYVSGPIRSNGAVSEASCRVLGFVYRAATAGIRILW